MIEIIPTNTCPPDYGELEKRSGFFSGFAREIQLDVDDAEFAPVRSWPYFGSQWEEFGDMVKRGGALPFAETLKYEAHLMVNDPSEIGELLARAGCKRILPHVEVLEDTQRARKMFESWRKAGANEIGLSVLIDTPLQKLDALIAECNSIQLMAIAQLGAQGAAFDERIFGRIKELHTMYPNLTIAIDGGVSEANIQDLVHVGATRFGVGSAISKSADPEGAYSRLNTLAEAALLSEV